MALHKLPNDHQTMIQVTFVACEAHPLFLITLNFVILIVDVRFLGFLVLKPQAIPMCVVWSEAGISAETLI